MILVDSSVWIDYFRGTSTPQAEKLDSLLGSEPVVTGDLVLTEVLRASLVSTISTRPETLTSLVVVDLGGQDIAIQAARNFRAFDRWGSP